MDKPIKGWTYKQLKHFLQRVFSKIPGLSNKYKVIRIASYVFYGFFGLLVLAFIIPTAPSLEITPINQTNKIAIDVTGKTYLSRVVSLIQNGTIIYQVESDSSGNFAFHLERLEEGSHTYTIKVCKSEEKPDLCRSINTTFTIDRTPPTSPVIASSESQTRENKILIEGDGEPYATAKFINKDNEYQADINPDGKFSTEIPLNYEDNKIASFVIDNAGNKSEEASISIYREKPVRVTRVVDGDTIEIETGQKVRYIGIDTPETVDPNKPQGCFGKEASNKNKELVEGKEIFLEKDVSETDRYGRLLRYIWSGDVMINKVLVEEGYAQASSYPPDIKYQDEFRNLQSQAQQNKKGLWGDICLIVPTPTPTSRPTPLTIKTNPTPTSTPDTIKYTPIPTTTTTTTYPPTLIIPTTGGSYVCDCDKTCSKTISSCAEAQYLLNSCGCSERDGDKDGIACDGAPLHCQY